MTRYVSYFPPTKDGDIEEGNRCLETIARLSSSMHDESLKSDGVFMADLLRGLKEAMTIDAYNHDANHVLIDPIIESIENSIGKQ